MQASIKCKLMCLYPVACSSTSVEAGLRTGVEAGVEASLRTGRHKHGCTHEHGGINMVVPMNISSGVEAGVEDSFRTGVEAGLRTGRHKHGCVEAGLRTGKKYAGSPGSIRPFKHLNAFRMLSIRLHLTALQLTDFSLIKSCSSTLKCGRSRISFPIRSIYSLLEVSCCKGANNIVVCNKEKCPSIEGCFRILRCVKDTYCRVCKGCHHAGRDYRHGTQWSDGCSHYDCRAGVLSISQKVCHVPCDNPLPPSNNGCCQRCQGCWFEGQLVADGSTVPSKSDPCVQCRCSGRTLTCEKRACPVLSCPKSKRHQTSDMCCPVCIGSRELFSPPGGRCFLEHYLYPTGANRTMDHCTTCACHHGYLTCNRKACPMLPCSKEFQVEKPGECCPSCPTIAAHGERVCMVHNVIREHGEHWNLDKCVTCTCNQGQVTCQAHSCLYVNKPCPPGFKRVESESECCPKCVEAPGVCTVFGDPHYKTFDGKLFNFQGACKYVLARSCRGKDKFNLKVINDARKSSHFSWTKSLSLKIAGAKITLGQKLRTKVQGKTIKPPYEKPGVVNITKTGHAITVSTPIGLRILWDGTSYVEVEVPLSMKKKTCGLCGNFNGDPDDDLTGQDGKLMDTVDKMALSWATGKIRACSRRMKEIGSKHEENEADDLPVGKNNNRKSELSRSSSLRHEKCAALNSTDFHTCNGALPPHDYFQSCLMDMCECKSESRHCECDTIQAYARECDRIGTPVKNWRNVTRCGGLECPSGAVYKDCAPPCRSSCTNITPNPDCYTRRCRPGCYCEPPLVLHRGACIMPEECPKKRKRRRRNR
ncbi:unnamed protein product, partial [Meganyctiphanes norvegica]